MTKGPSKSEPGPARILVVDDHPVVREGLVRLLGDAPGLAVCGESGDKEGTLRLLAETKPDLVLLDLTLKQTGGVTLVRDITLRYPETRVLVLSLHDESVYAERVLRAGGRGYVMKDQPSQTIITAIRTILAGELYLSPRMSTKILGKIVQGAPAAGADELALLSDRELDIFRMIGEGLSSRKIAGELHLSVKTVDSHRENIKAKLRLESGRELDRKAVLWVRKETRS